jgi:DNA-binding response OmpR family regulator
MKQIVLVEDDPILGRALVLTLETAGYQVQWYESLGGFSNRSDFSNFDLFILDVGLPDGNGITFLRDLRSHAFKVPAILLTARDHVDSVVDGLGAGANDYIKKPFDNKELLARIRAVLREPTFTERKLKVGGVLINIEKRKVTWSDQEVNLNRRQFDILVYLAERQGIVVSRDSLISAIKSDGEMFDRTVDAHISHLRSVLKKNEIDQITISSVYGVGYRLEVTERKTNEN